MSLEAAIFGLGLCLGLLLGFGLWECLDRTKFAAYRAAYRWTHKEPSP